MEAASRIPISVYGKEYESEWAEFQVIQGQRNSDISVTFETDTSHVDPFLQWDSRLPLGLASERPWLYGAQR